MVDADAAGELPAGRPPRAEELGRWLEKQKRRRKKAKDNERVRCRRPDRRPSPLQHTILRARAWVRCQPVSARRSDRPTAGGAGERADAAGPRRAPRGRGADAAERGGAERPLVPRGRARCAPPCRRAGSGRVTDAACTSGSGSRIRGHARSAGGGCRRGGHADG